MPTALAPAIGPVLGGLLVTDLSWRWVFYVNLPIGMVGVLFGLLFLREQRGDERDRFDLPGFLLSGLGLGALMYALVRRHGKGLDLHGNHRVGRGGARGARRPGVGRAACQRADAGPAAASNRLFRTTTGALIVSTAAFLGSLFLVSLFYQDGFGVSALQSGLSTFPEALGIMAGSQVAGRLYPRYGPRRLMIPAWSAWRRTLALIATVPFTASLWLMRGYMLLLGLAQAHVFMPAQAAAFATVSPAATGRASTMFSAGRQLGGAVGVAVLSTVISAIGVLHHVGGTVRPDAGAYHAAFLAAAGIALVGALWATAINDADAAPTMRPTRRHRVAPAGI